MAKPLSLDQVNHEIKCTQDRIDALAAHINGLEDHVALLKNLEKQFRQNLAVLKDHSIIAMASEYKKVKEDLRVLLGKQEEAELDLKNSSVFMGRAKRLLIDLNGKRDIILESGNGKVLTGNFGNNGKE
jgi:hypothetical protein